MLDNIKEFITFTSALVTFLIAYVQYKANQQNLKKELFDRRCNFYDELKSIYYSLDATGKSAPYCQIEDISHLMPKAKWLFGEDMCEAIQELNCKEIDEIDRALGVLPNNIEKLFAKYMHIESNYNFWTFICAVFVFFIPEKIIKYLKA
ncbi:MAG: hypothetical protein IJE43_07375 [Alphaproteobacteria bacterium]|nr:hypothetical protein [Alphaproteobacteria bacterium]